MIYPTRPLVDTRLANILKMHKMPAGVQTIVALACLDGYNQEDSLLINEAAVERGLFLSTLFHTEKDEDKKINGDEQIRCIPEPAPKTRGLKFGNYKKLNEHGFIPENTLVENRDMIIGKVVTIKENRNDPAAVAKFEDQSKMYRTTDETYIDQNFISRNGDGYNFSKV